MDARLNPSATWLSVSAGAVIIDQHDQNVHVARSLSDFLFTSIKSPSDEIALVSLGLRSSVAEPLITSFVGSMGYLHDQSTTMTLAEKRGALSVLGAVLRQGYSPSISPNTDMESLFQNARRRGTNGGVCNDIHAYLAHAASSMGFDDAGTHTGVWKEWLDTRYGGWHVVSHFREPATGEYYMQNYEEVFATGQKTLINLVEVSSRILGYTWKSSVNSLPGVAHEYVPRFSRWLWDGIEREATGPINGPLVAIGLTNREQSTSMHYGWADLHQQFKLYGVASRFDADEGQYAYGSASASYTLKGGATWSDAWLDEIGIAGTGYAGILWFETPILRPDEEGHTLRTVQWDYTSSLYGFSGSGFLRKGRSTLDLSAHVMAATGQDSRDEFALTLTHRFKSLPLSIRVQRAFALVNLEHHNRFDVAYDSIRAELRLRPFANVSMSFQAAGYALGGVDDTGGWAGRGDVAISYTTRSAGVFSFGGEWGQVLQNTSNDPFYDLPSSRFVNVGWQMRLAEHFTLGTQLSYGEGPAVQPFDTFGTNTPELRDGSRQMGGLVSLTWGF